MPYQCSVQLNGAGCCVRTRGLLLCCRHGCSSRGLAVMERVDFFPPQQRAVCVAVLALCMRYTWAGCSYLNDCNGHGACVLVEGRSVCDCFDGYGSASDVATYKAPDCSLRRWRGGTAVFLVPLQLQLQYHSRHGL